MRVFLERVGRREQKQRRIPEPHKIAHECLLIGKDKSGKNDQQFGDDDKERQPDDGYAAFAGGDHRTDKHQRDVDIGAAQVRQAKRCGDVAAEQDLVDVLDPQERNDGIGNSDEENRPEGKPDQIFGDAVEPGAVTAKAAASACLPGGIQDRGQDKRALRETEARALGTGQHIPRARQSEPEYQKIIDNKDNGQKTARDTEISNAECQPFRKGSARSAGNRAGSICHHCLSFEL